MNLAFVLARHLNYRVAFAQGHFADFDEAHWSDEVPGLFAANHIADVGVFQRRGRQTQREAIVNFENGDEIGVLIRPRPWRGGPAGGARGSPHIR